MNISLVNKKSFVTYNECVSYNILILQKSCNKKVTQNCFLYEFITIHVTYTYIKMNDSTLLSRFFAITYYYMKKHLIIQYQYLVQDMKKNTPARVFY